jgi:hypothetical protein
MGLCIKGKKSKKEYYYSYSGLHQIRWLALLSLGMSASINNNETYNVCYGYFDNLLTDPLSAIQERQSFSFYLQESGYYFPNLMFHSDCEGRYTKVGKVFSNGNLTTGNSIELLKELKFIKRRYINKTKLEELSKNDLRHHAFEIFNSFYELVKDEVQNGYGILTFI